MEETKANAKKEREGERRKRRTRKGEGGRVVVDGGGEEGRGEGGKEEARGDPRLLGSSRESEPGKEKGGKIN